MPEGDERGATPTVGVVLVAAVALTLAAVTGVLVFSLTDSTSQGPPKGAFSTEELTTGIQITHERGSTFDVENLYLLYNGEKRPVTEFTPEESLLAGDSIGPIDPDGSSQLVLTWEGDGESHVVHVADEYDTLDFSDLNKDGTVVYEGLNSVAGDGGERSALNLDDVQVIGSSDKDLNGDGGNDLPYIKNGNLQFFDGKETTQTLVSDSDSSDPAESKTLMAVTEWQGSDTSVFYVDGDNEEIYRVDDSGSPTVVATPNKGAQAVMGTGDIDGDGTDELLFADGSQQVRYLEPDRTVEKLDGAQAGSNNGIGVGQPPDFDGDGTVRVALVDGSNNVKIAGGAESSKTFSATEAAKAPVTASDVDDDNDPEVVYVSDDGINNGPDKPLRYIDDPFGGSSIELLEDDDGDPIDGDGELGVVS